jgi:catechol 2,3-dioxygenase-like lactoylglutathione lyase family enzyme
MKLEVHHASILTTDIDESISFYRKNLGMRLTSRFHQEDGMNTAFLADGPRSTPYELQLIGPPFLGWMGDIFEEHGPSMDHHAILVANLDDWYPKLRSEGLEILEEPSDFLTSRHMVFKDLSGIVVELVEGTQQALHAGSVEESIPSTGIVYFMNHISILCNDLAGLERFYNRVFGMKTVYDHRELGYIYVVDPAFQEDKTREAVPLEIMGPEGGYERDLAFLAKHGPGLDHICFVVKDVDAAYGDLIDRGVDFWYPPEDTATNRLAFFKDPSGVDVELMHSIPRSRLGL